MLILICSIEFSVFCAIHTQMEADSVHFTIERTTEMRVINVPSEYVVVCKYARKNPRAYDVNFWIINFSKDLITFNFL